MRYRAALKRNGVPWFSRTILTRIEGTDAVTAAVISSVDCEWRPIGGSEQRFEVDAVAMGYGLLPSIELPRLCGCAVQYDALARTWRPVRSAQFESSVPGIFLVGDGAGVAGVIVAIEEGRVAGLAIATQLGKLPASEAMQKSAPHMKRLAALGRVRAALDHAYALRQGVFELGHGETMVCRCEEVTFDDLEEAVQDGADNPTILKSFTRCGMGPCQGRMCAATTAEWLAARTGREISTVPLTPAAPPAKPVVTLEALVSTEVG
jgi:NAD(P)H-nitrite reductase large subunit